MLIQYINLNKIMKSQTRLIQNSTAVFGRSGRATWRRVCWIGRGRRREPESKEESFQKSQVATESPSRCTPSSAGCRCSISHRCCRCWARRVWWSRLQSWHFSLAIPLHLPDLSVPSFWNLATSARRGRTPAAWSGRSTGPRPGRACRFGGRWTQVLGLWLYLHLITQ